MDEGKMTTFSFCLLMSSYSINQDDGVLYNFYPYFAIPFTLQNGMTERYLKFLFFPKALHAINDTLTGTFTK